MYRMSFCDIISPEFLVIFPHALTHDSPKGRFCETIALFLCKTPPSPPPSPFMVEQELPENTYQHRCMTISFLRKVFPWSKQVSRGAEMSRIWKATHRLATDMAIYCQRDSKEKYTPSWASSFQGEDCPHFSSPIHPDIDLCPRK